MAKPTVFEEVQLYDILSNVCGKYIGMASAAILTQVRKELTKGIGTGGEKPTGILANVQADLGLTDHEAALLEQFSEAEAVAAWTKLTDSIDIGIGFRSILTRDPNTYGWSLEPGESVTFENGSTGELSAFGSWEVDVDIGFVHVGWKS